MKVPSTQILTFYSNDLAAPDDWNEVFRQAAGYLDEAAQRRWVHGVLPVQFTQAGSPYTKATPLAIRTYRFIAPTTCIVERVIADSSITSTSDVQITIFATSGGATPQGATNPLLTIPATPVVSSVTNAGRFLLTAGTDYSIQVNGPGTFTIERLDLSLHCLFDRFMPAGAADYPVFSPSLVSTLNPNDVVSNTNALATQTAKLAGNLVAPTPIGVIKHAFTSSTTRHYIPMANAGVQGRFVGLYVAAAMALTGGTAQVVTLSLLNAAGAVVGSVSANVAGSTGGAAYGTINIPAVAGAGPTASASDYSLLLSSTGTSVNTVAKATGICWVSR